MYEVCLIVEKIQRSCNIEACCKEGIYVYVMFNDHPQQLNMVFAYLC